MRSRKSLDISKRTFLRAAGASLAMPAILPASAVGAGKTVAPSNRINMGVIGTGGRANGLTKNAMAHDFVRVIALCDLDKSQLAKAKSIVDQNYGNTDCAVHADYRELLARKDVDAVIVATPGHWHALVCVEAARRGKDIYCEKPLTWSLGEGQAVVKAVKENKRVLPGRQHAALQRPIQAGL